MGEDFGGDEAQLVGYPLVVSEVLAVALLQGFRGFGRDEAVQGV